MIEFVPRHADAAFTQQYGARFRKALEKRFGPVAISFDQYVQSAVLQSCGASFEEAARAIGLGMAELFVAGYPWNDRLGQEPRLLAIYTAKVRIGHARHVRGARPLPPPRPATHVSTLKCPRCGAPKVTKSRTAYVYCDYCAMLFDYDFEQAKHAQGGLPLGEVTHALREPLLPEIRAAREARDDAKWLELWTWVFRTEMDVCPEGWSPRVGDPVYANAMAEWCARTSIVRALEPRIAQGAERMNDTWLRSLARPSAQALIAYAEACLAQADLTAQIWTQHGLFASHPDELDPATFRRLEVKSTLRECLPNADDQARARILALAGLDFRLEPVPHVDLAKTICSCCGGPLLLAAGSKRLVCEMCGNVLDPSAPRFPCPQCGAAVIAAKTGELPCAWCGTRFECV